MRKFVLVFIVLLILNLVIHSTPQAINKDQSSADITVQEVLDKHFASIGKKEDLESIKSRVMVGSVKSNFVMGSGRQYTGAAQFASAGNKVLLAMIFDSSEYLYEKAGFDGDKFFVGLPGGSRTNLGDFFKSQEVIFKDGVFGGTLSSSWLALNSDAIKKDLKYAGIEKIDNQEFHKIKYSPRSSGDLRISFYFNTKDYRHSSTRYEFTTISRMSSSPTQAIKQKEYRYLLIEQFGDYKTVGKLTLPNTYQLDLTIQTESTRRQIWNINFAQFFYNEPLESQVFRVS